MNNYETLKAEIVKVCPEIMEHKMNHMGDNRFNCIYCAMTTETEFKDCNGSPIQLYHVLRWLDTLSKPLYLATDGDLFDTWDNEINEVMCHWDLTKPNLEDNPEVILFLCSLIGEEERK